MRQAVFGVSGFFLAVGLGTGCAGQGRAARHPDAEPRDTSWVHDSTATGESTAAEESGNESEAIHSTPEMEDRESSGFRAYPDEDTGVEEDTRTDEDLPEGQPLDDDTSSQYGEHVEEG